MSNVVTLYCTDGSTDTYPMQFFIDYYRKKLINPDSVGRVFINESHYVLYENIKHLIKYKLFINTIYDGVVVIGSAVSWDEFYKLFCIKYHNIPSSRMFALWCYSDENMIQEHFLQYNMDYNAILKEAINYFSNQKIITV